MPLMAESEETMKKLIDSDNLFDELLIDNSYVDLIMVLHYILARVKWNKYKDEYGNDIENKYGYLKESIYNNLEILNAEPIELW